MSLAGLYSGLRTRRCDSGQRNWIDGGFKMLKSVAAFQEGVQRPHIGARRDS